MNRLCRCKRSGESGQLRAGTADSASGGQRRSFGSFLPDLHADWTMRRMLQLGTARLRTCQAGNGSFSGILKQKKEKQKFSIFLFDNQQVIKTQYAGGSKVKFAGKEIVPVQKHTQCKCQCKTKESVGSVELLFTFEWLIWFILLCGHQDCGRNQAYVPGACKCECTNLDDRRKCEAENQTRWSSCFIFFFFAFFR